MTPKELVFKPCRSTSESHAVKQEESHAVGVKAGDADRDAAASPSETRAVGHPQTLEEALDVPHPPPTRRPRINPDNWKLGRIGLIREAEDPEFVEQVMDEIRRAR
ncbi:MAG: hypothetical protein EOO38_01605 [Cytophagaceae bacterium]|nr:MAG: hypothetical protein EOO38_01605 [Cytophagaceae bacterium]